MAELEQTRGKFKLIGKVSHIDSDYAYEEGEMNKPNTKNHGKEYRKLRFGVQTSENNTVFVECFDYKPDEVFLWSNEERAKNKKYKGTRVPLAEWMEEKDEYRKNGFTVPQSKIGIIPDDKGSYPSHGIPRYIMAEEAYNGLNNDDSIMVKGEIRYSSYKNSNTNKIVKQRQLVFEEIKMLKNPIDFDSEDFEEVAIFQQPFVFIDSDLDKKEGKNYITSRTINYRKEFEDVELVVNYIDSDGKKISELEDLAKNFNKIPEFGDLLTVFGKIINEKVIDEERQQDDDDEDDKKALLAKWGGKKKPRQLENPTFYKYISEMRIEGIEDIFEGKYEEEDFVNNENSLDVEDKSSKQSLVSDKSKNPFKNDEDSDNIDISDEDLPF